MYNFQLPEFLKDWKVLNIEMQKKNQITEFYFYLDCETLCKLILILIVLFKLPTVYLFKKS